MPEASAPLPAAPAAAGPPQHSPATQTLPPPLGISTAGGSSSSTHHPTADRFLPTNPSESSKLLFSEKSSEAVLPRSDYERMLAENCLGRGQVGELEAGKVLAYSKRPPPPVQTGSDEMQVVFSIAKNARNYRGGGGGEGGRTGRVIEDKAFRTLDAPDFLDDFYLNLLDWSAQNVVAVALGGLVYLWNGNTASTTELCSLPEDGDTCFTSVRFTKDGNHLALGLSDNTTQLWDLGKSKQLRAFRTHSARVGSLAWNGPLLSTGSKDFEIHNHDVRVRDHLLSKMSDGFHQQEVCALEWSLDGKTLASGGNDNIICLTDEQNMSVPAFVLSEHRAAVKALSWCPWQRNLLASGAGSNDQRIRFWNTGNGVCVNEIPTESQITQLRWSNADREIAASHGFSKNQVCVWKYPSLQKVADLNGHTNRILSMVQSPDGTTLLTAGADETLRFWKVFSVERSNYAVSEGARGGSQDVGAKSAVTGAAASLGCKGIR
mmetsp:Transcript_10705/g.26225  ORF Transcript_10705/g.26225 Transcript_10705/m.26225 type:complete len:491 (-) Transcript_10705:621-2093(-)